MVLEAVIKADFHFVGIEVLVLGKARREPELRRKRGKSCDHGGSSYVNRFTPESNFRGSLSHVTSGRMLFED